MTSVLYKSQGTMRPFFIVGVVVLVSVETQAAEAIKKSFSVAAGGRLVVETDRGTMINNGRPKLILRTSGGNIRVGKMS
jgi:hypothetical protein